jgi:hypothetical protein
MSAAPADPSAKQKTPRRRTLSLALRGLAGAAVLVVGLSPTSAWADPPSALPSAYSGDDNKYQPAMDYDTDGCYPTPAIGPDGTLNPGLELGGDVNGHCRDESDLDNTNSYSRSKCNNGWCAYVYDFYFEKDQISDGGASLGHKHDWEHIVVWVDQSDSQVKYVSTSQHGKYAVHSASEVSFEGTHPKIVYHKDGVGSHDFRLGNADEQPENHKGAWQYPDLVSWDKFPPGLWDKLTSADFGEATMAIRDQGGAYTSNLSGSKPSDIPFDPNA